MYERSVTVETFDHHGYKFKYITDLLYYYRHLSITFIIISYIIIIREVCSKLKSRPFILVQGLFVMNRGIWTKTGPITSRVRFEKDFEVNILI